MKKGDAVECADDKARTSASQNHATATLCLGKTNKAEFFIYGETLQYVSFRSCMDSFSSRLDTLHCAVARTIHDLLFFTVLHMFTDFLMILSLW
jgi:hypothetical protein